MRYLANHNLSVKIQLLPKGAINVRKFRKRNDNNRNSHMEEIDVIVASMDESTEGNDLQIELSTKSTDDGRKSVQFVILFPFKQCI